MVLDKTLPILTSIAVTSDDSPTTLAKIGSVVTLSFLSDSFIQTPSVTIAGHAATVLSTTTLAKFWTASTTVASLDTSGALTFTITTPTDYATNATTSATWLTSGSNVTVYGTVPSVSITGANPDSIYSTVNAVYSDPGATATDVLGGSPSVSTSGSVNAQSFGTYSLTYTTTDAAGNSTSASRTVNVKMVPGGGPIASGGGGGGGSVAVALPNNGGGTANTTTPTSPSGTPATIAGLQAELQSLLAQIAALTGTTANGFTRDLTIGASGGDVKALQVWLNAHGYTIAASGPGSSGNETTKFGGLTRAALAKWQKAVGISPASGYFGAKTRAYLAAHQ